MVPLPVTFPDVAAAAERIAKFAHRTPVQTSNTLDRMLDAQVFFKCENFQKAGAFKFRGACNAVALLSDDQRRRGVVTHSSGNHAQALALAAAMKGVGATVVMPHDAPAVKVEATRGYGAAVVQVPAARRAEAADEIAQREGRVLVHPSNDAAVIAGQGTACMELVEDVGDLDLVLAPVGGGGLLSGTAIAAKRLRPACDVVGVEPAMADDAYRSLQTGEIQPSHHPPTVADGLRTPLGSNTFPLIRKWVREIVLVEELEIIGATRWVWERMKLVIEPSSAAPVAALLNGKVDASGKRVGVILSGGNVALDRFFDMLASG